MTLFGALEFCIFIVISLHIHSPVSTSDSLQAPGRCLRNVLIILSVRLPLLCIEILFYISLLARLIVNDCASIMTLNLLLG